AGEEDDRQHDHRDQKGRDHRDSGRSGPSARSRAFLLALGYCSHGSSLAPSLAPSTLRNGRADLIRAVPRQTTPERGLNRNSTRYSGAAGQLGEVGGDPQISDFRSNLMRKRFTLVVGLPARVALAIPFSAALAGEPVSGSDGNTQ